MLAALERGCQLLYSLSAFEFGYENSVLKYTKFLIKYICLQCDPITGLGFRRGSYKCVCKIGFYYPDTKAEYRYYNGTIIEDEYEKLLMVSVKHLFKFNPFMLAVSGHSCKGHSWVLFHHTMDSICIFLCNVQTELSQLP